MPPVTLFPFPTEKKDQERRQRWIKNINRKDANTGKLWNPTYNDRVCSIYCELEMDSLSKLSEVVGSEEIVTLDSFLFLITGSPLMT
jgi:hypothetical protein